MVLLVFAKTWSEELVAEWLTTQGFAVLVNVPIKSGEKECHVKKDEKKEGKKKSKKGGRKEADVVGFKITEKGSVEIRHYEISSAFTNLRDAAERIADKFCEDRIEEVKNYVKMIIGTSRVSEFEYKKIAILFSSPRMPEKIKKELEELGYRDIELWSFEEFFESQVMDIVKEKAREKRTFPDSLWLLNMLYVLCDKKLLAGCHHL